MFLNLIFILFVLMIAKTIWLLIKENKSNKGGWRLGRHFNGRFYW